MDINAQPVVTGGRSVLEQDAELLAQWAPPPSVCNCGCAWVNERHCVETLSCSVRNQCVSAAYLPFTVELIV